MEMRRKSFYRAYSCARSTARSSTASERWNAASGQCVATSYTSLRLQNPSMAAPLPEARDTARSISVFHRSHHVVRTGLCWRRTSSLSCCRLLHVRNGNCKYHLGEETFKLAQSYMDKLAKHGHEANKAALYGELCALLFAKSHYDEVGPKRMTRKHFNSVVCLLKIAASLMLCPLLSM